MNEQTYWTGIYRKRLSRRRLLSGTALGAAGVASAALAGCGGGDEGGENGGGATQAPTTGPAAQPKKGGVFRAFNNGNPTSLDPHRFQSSLANKPANYVYSRLMMFDSGPKVPHWKLSPIGDLAESYEVTPDGLTFTFKLKGNARFHPPLDRPVDAEDVALSVRRFMGLLPGFAGKQNKEQLSVVDSVSASDARTVVFKLKRPYTFFVLKIADPIGVQIVPKEIGTAFDPAQRMVGSGPFIFDSFTPDSVVKFRRNAAWHFGPDKPYFDAVEMYVLSQQAPRRTQFLGGNIDEDTVNDIDYYRQIKSTLPDAALAVVPGSMSPLYLAFSLDDPPNSPWLKQEVRQAMSMAIDQNVLLDAALGPWKAAGFEVKYSIDNAIPAAYTDYWLDPADSRAAKYFKYDVAGAKALLKQAGYENGFNATFTTMPLLQQGITGTRQDLVVSMLKEIGVNLEVKSVDLQAVYSPQVQQGKYDGLANIGVQGAPDPLDSLGPLWRASATRNFSKINDPELEGLLDKAEAAKDEKEARQRILEVQNYLNEKMYFIPMTGGSGGSFHAYAPKVKNGAEYTTLGTEGTMVGDGPERISNMWKDV